MFTFYHVCFCWKHYKVLCVLSDPLPPSPVYVIWVFLVYVFIVYCIDFVFLHMYMCLLYFYIFVSSSILNVTFCRHTIHSALGFFNTLTRVQFTHHPTPILSVIQWLLINVQSCTAITVVQFQNISIAPKRSIIPICIPSPQPPLIYFLSLWTCFSRPFR